jgi:hypothetical protein
MDLPTAAQKQQAQAMAGMAQQQAAVTGQPPQLPPDLQAILASPSWEDVLALLTDDITRDYRIDIEANSTIDADATEDQQDIAEFMNAIGQFLSGTVPLIEQGVMPFDVMKSVLLAIVQRYRFGREVADSIRNMQAPQQQGNPAEDAKNQAAQAQAQADLAKIKAQADADHQELQGRLQEMAAEMANKREELRIHAAELQLKAEAQAREAQRSAQEHQQKLELMAAQHAQAMAAVKQKGKSNANV